MSKDLNCAVIGVGYLGRFHAQKYGLVSGAQLIGVSDSDVNRSQEVADELGVKSYPNFRELVGEVDAVTVAASTPAHYEIARFFLENGVHVNVEKPITSTSKQAKELCDLAEKNNLKLQVGHVERFNPALIAARSKLEKPLFIECHRLAPFKVRSTEVDVVLDLMIHDLDVVLSLMQSHPSEVAAVGSPVLTQTIDIANARVEFESGAVANMTASRVSQKSQRKFRVFQPNQYLSIDFESGEVSLLTKTGEWKEDEVPLDAESWSLKKGDALLDETQAFVNCIRNDSVPVVTGRDGLAALELAEKILKTIDAGKEAAQIKGL